MKLGQKQTTVIIFFVHVYSTHTDTHTNTFIWNFS